jgi:hypothetical protein
MMMMKKKRRRRRRRKLRARSKGEVRDTCIM